ncbi:hypothetical protein DFH06DRAFT_1477241 [Mycena polygramma]|nr:hypothetical protein DFH06DRAFT_1477241 [Mycena polygramma]
MVMHSSRESQEPASQPFVIIAAGGPTPLPISGVARQFRVRVGGFFKCRHSIELCFETANQLTLLSLIAHTCSLSGALLFGPPSQERWYGQIRHDLCRSVAIESLDESGVTTIPLSGRTDIVALPFASACEGELGPRQQPSAYDTPGAQIIVFRLYSELFLFQYFSPHTQLLLRHRSPLHPFPLLPSLTISSQPPLFARFSGLIFPPGITRIIALSQLSQQSSSQAL